MLERSERTLRIACVCLAALLLYQFARLVVQRDPLANLTIPALPSLPPSADAQAAGVPTNSVSRPSSSRSGTNSLAGQESGKQETSVISSAKTGTNLATGQSLPMSETNALAGQEPEKRGSNAISAEDLATPGMASIPRSGRLAGGMRTGSPAEMAMMGMNPMSRGGPGLRGSPLPPAIQARVNRIIDSELLAPVIRPLPMALLGIAGKDVFLRAPNGQTSLVKEGGEVGGVKLLRIGINRVLVEEDGQKKELTIFSGLGGESLLPKERETPQ